jgi:hypothetical protein
MIRFVIYFLAHQLHREKRVREDLATKAGAVRNLSRRAFSIPAHFPAIPPGTESRPRHDARRHCQFDNSGL